MLSGFAVMPGGLAMLIMMPIAGQVTGLMQPKYWMAIGLATIALAMWYSTSLTPDASFGYFVTIRIFQTIGLPFLFIPINSVSYDGLPQQKTSEGSALMNVARNLGGSFGVSLANTELLQRSQFHQARLVENVVPSSPVYQSIVKQITEFFANTGSPANAAGRAMGYIGHMIESQAAILAYIDIFYSWAIFAACLIPVVLLLIRRVRRGAAEATAMH
jgi:DHA2 family multidrug resistance protein